MRFRVRFEYNEQTGEVEVFHVDAVDAVDGSRRAADHDQVHDRVSAELAGVVERDAGVVEDPSLRYRDPEAVPPLAASREEVAREREVLPPEALGG